MDDGDDKTAEGRLDDFMKYVDRFVDRLSSTDFSFSLIKKKAIADRRLRQLIIGSLYINITSPSL